MSTVNAWKYGRQIYLIGRSNKFRELTAKEREAVIEFITAIVSGRKAIADRLNIKKGNPAKELENQNSYSLLKMVQVIGRNFKVTFPTVAEKELCDTLIAAVAPRAEMGYKDYQTDVEEESQESSGEEVVEESEGSSEEEVVEEPKEEIIEESEEPSEEPEESSEEEMGEEPKAE